MSGRAPTHVRGDVITFYSYKGGTGRTMALANVACVLAERLAADENLLVIDWDLEAPGLHRFFPGRPGPTGAATDRGLDASAGLIDYFTALSEALPTSPAESEDAADAAVAAALEQISLDAFIGESGISRIHIMRAGRNDDGHYSRRVNTFNWEHLFRRAPTVYRRFAERLAERFRYVLIDSRTGVTDISGICTSLLPEKLVLVFTPNRQSLTGVRELVASATTYRRTSDDLRPLLIYPLPSRIEASLQDLRTVWRFGNRDLDIAGYQPMFELALADAYGLAQCDLGPYFDEVQIQQTPDYAYGEEIAVRRTSDRFSLGNSYRVFVGRLASSAPPWVQTLVEPSPRGRAATERQPQVAVAPKPGAVTLAAGTDATADVGRSAPAPLGIFISFSREDRQRVVPLVEALEAQGWDVWFDRDVVAGLEYDRVVGEAIDRADAIVVCWSKASTTSQHVMTEAYEGLRRGVLVPVLLDDVAPPLGFRQLQAADLRREDRASLALLVESIGVVGRGRPGSPALPVAPSGPAHAATAKPTWIAAAAIAAVAAVVVIGAFLWFGTRAPQTSPPPTDTTSTSPTDTPPVTASSASPAITLPNFVGSQTADVLKTAELLKLQVVMRDERGQESAFYDGVVTAQSPPAGAAAAAGTQVQLSVTTSTASVPTLARTTLDSALRQLEANKLRLGVTNSRYVRDVKPGTIISQNPEPGARVASGTAVDVVVASNVAISAADQQQILATLDGYREAYNARSVDRILRVYQNLSRDSVARARLEETFRRCVAYSLRLEIDPAAIVPGSVPNSARVAAVADYTCTTASGDLTRGREAPVFELRRSGSEWVLTNVSSPPPRQR